MCRGIEKGTLQFRNETEGLGEVNVFVAIRYVSDLRAECEILQAGYIDMQPLLARIDVKLNDHHTAYYQKRNERMATGRERSGAMIIKWF